MTPAHPFPLSTPEEQGVPPRALLAFLEKLDAMAQLHGLVIQRHGKTILQASWKPYDAKTPHHLFSLSKSFVSCAVGLAIQEGRLRLDQTLGELFPREASQPGVSPLAKQATLRNLLTMRAGQASCHLGPFLFHPTSQTLVERYLQVPMATRPGEAFVYNSGSTYMLSAALQKATGQTVAEYLQPRLFTPLGIHSPRWLSCPNGIPLGGWGLYLTLEELSRFTRLIADHGQWEGRQLLPPDYLREATSFQSDNSINGNRDWDCGYGYQFWQCSHPGAFRGDGAFGQYAIVVPDYDLAITTQAGMPEMGRLLFALWDDFLPALHGTPLPPDPDARQALAEKTARLEVPRPQGAYQGAAPGGHYRLEENPLGFQELQCEFQGGGGRLTLVRNGKAHPLEFRYGDWSRCQAPGLYDAHTPMGGELALSAAWETPSVLLLHTAFLNEPTLGKFRLDFQEGQVDITRDFNHWFLYGPDDMHIRCRGHRLPS